MQIGGPGRTPGNAPVAELAAKPREAVHRMGKQCAAGRRLAELECIKAAV